MEMASTSPPVTTNGAPFRDYDVREWSRLDATTGVLERARRESDRWDASNSQVSHQYGKVVDTLSRTAADGAVQRQARKLEVFHSETPGSRYQLIKTHTVCSKKWSGKDNAEVTKEGNRDLRTDFEDLQLEVHPLDITSQKSKASVGRSVARRPPTRRSLESSYPLHPSNPIRNTHLTAATNLHRVSRLCHQIHESAVRHAFGSRYPPEGGVRLPEIRQNGEGRVEITEIDSSSSESTESSNALLPGLQPPNGYNNISGKTVEKPRSFTSSPSKKLTSGHSNLVRTRSNSSENLFSINNENATKTVVESDLEDLEQLRDWRRTSKLRRSLQFSKENRNLSKPNDLPENTGSVRKILNDLEHGKRLNKALRGNNVNLEALDQILQTVSSSSSSFSDGNSVSGDNLNEIETDLIAHKKEKRNSFVTQGDLLAIKNKLRPTVKSDAIQNAEEARNYEDIDDGLGIEEKDSFRSLDESSEIPPHNSKVRSYVYGVEEKLNTKTGLGTGSLGSKTKQFNLNGSNRFEDWYNRRKSYGFENVHNHNESVPLKFKNPVESSTDSGICRSTEIVMVPALPKAICFNNERDVGNSFDDTKLEKITSNVKNITSFFDQRQSENDLRKLWKRFTPSNFEKDYNIASNLEPTKIAKPKSVVNVSMGSIYPQENSTSDYPEKEFKRHSVAVVESNYVNNSCDKNSQRTISNLVMNEKIPVYLNGDQVDDENSSSNKRGKKVEFCKTEVHFAPDSGKVNIVETDGKPPPTNNFRRRRKNSSPICADDVSRNDLQILHFGDSYYEKSLLGFNNNNGSDIETKTTENIYENIPQQKILSPTVTVNTGTECFNVNDEYKKNAAELENRKGILKNKSTKPIPYHLGENVVPLDIISNANDNRWRAKLKPLTRNEPPIWKSTVTLHNNTFYDTKNNPAVHGEDTKTISNIKMNTTEVKKLLNKSRQNITNRLVEIDKAISNTNNDHLFEDNLRPPLNIENLGSGYSHSTENRGFSTRINFGNEVTVVKNETQNEKNRNELLSEPYNTFAEKKQIVSKGLIVRIGSGDSSSQTVCSKTTIDENSKNAKSTTKITIDRSPSQAQTEREQEFLQNFIKGQRSQHHSFKSTSLILDTLRDKENFINNYTDEKKESDEKIQDENYKVPASLENLKKLYENSPSDSEVDREVQLLMSGGVSGYNKISASEEDRNSSVVSGSWSKMRACKAFTHQLAKSSNAIPKTTNAQINEDISTQPGELNKRIPHKDEYQQKQSLNDTSSFQYENANKYSPIISRKASSESFLAPTIKKLSSPSLVCSSDKLDLRKFEQSGRLSKTTSSNNSVPRSNIVKNTTTITEKISPPKEHKPITNKFEGKLKGNESVLRQPKASEMTYFGIASPKPANIISQANIRKGTALTEKCDSPRKLPDSVERKTKKSIKHVPPSPSPSPSKASNKKSRSPDPSNEMNTSSHIYENIDNAKYKNQFDISILDELTRAADQILQAVNEYTKDDVIKRFSTENESSSKTKLATISETSSWKSTDKKPNKTSTSKVKSKTKPKNNVSSASSLESITNETNKFTSRKSKDDDKTKVNKKSQHCDSGINKALTKARRLQRATSREALLQSHGSSSEDLPMNFELPLRKHRLIRKNKTSPVLSNVGNKKRSSSNPINEQKEEKENTEERVQKVLPEIRHKTAVSRIRSTAEKTASREKSRERNKLKQEGTKKKMLPKSEAAREANSSEKVEGKKDTTVTAHRTPRTDTRSRQREMSNFKVSVN